MLVCESEALIDARFSTVWDVLTDSSNLEVWNSGIADINGELRDGTTVRLTIARHSRTLRVRIRQRPPEHMTWTATVPLLLFKVVRSFVLTPHAERTLLQVTDKSSGPLRRWFPPATAEDLTGFVDAVQHRAELFERTHHRAGQHHPKRSTSPNGNDEEHNPPTDKGT
jgi:hypothetical protein